MLRSGLGPRDAPSSSVDPNFRVGSRSPGDPGSRVVNIDEGWEGVEGDPRSRNSRGSSRNFPQGSRRRRAGALCNAAWVLWASQGGARGQQAEPPSAVPRNRSLSQTAIEEPGREARGCLCAQTPERLALAWEGSLARSAPCVQAHCSASVRASLGVLSSTQLGNSGSGFLPESGR